MAPDDPLPSGDVATSSAADMLEQGVHGQKRHEDEVEPSTSPKRAKFANVSFSLRESTFLAEDSETIHVPKTPKLSEEAAKKQMNQVTSTDLSLCEHEDSLFNFLFSRTSLMKWNRMT